MTDPLPSALEHFAGIAERIPPVGPALFLDYDGTLSALQPRPEMAVMEEPVRTCLRVLAERCFVAVVSGRDRAVVEDLVSVPDLYYAGSHGFDISGPGGLTWEQEEGARSRPALAEASRQLESALEPVDGAWVEPKRYATSVHFRQVDDALLPEVERIVRTIAREHTDLRVSEGKRVLELRPNVDWHKGRAVAWLMETMNLGDTLPIYIGDDVTDEDALETLRERGIGIRVGDPDVRSAASYRLADVPEVHQFLEFLRVELS